MAMRECLSLRSKCIYNILFFYWINEIRRGDKMDFRQAVMQDLPQLKDMYKRIIKDMNEQNIQRVEN